VKHLIAFAVALGVFITLAFAFNSVNAQGTPYPAADVSTTPTFTPTTNPCVGPPPAAVTLKAPQKGTSTSAQQVTLRWTKVACVTKYFVTIRRGSKTGPLEQKGGTTTKKYFITHPLAPNKYVWFVRACNGKMCTKSAFSNFTVTAPKPPPSDGVPPILPAPHNNLVQFNGGYPDGVYIGTSSGTRFYRDCIKGKYPHIGGGMLYFTVLGFQGYQSVTVWWQSFTDQGYHYVTNVTSDQYGRVQWAVNTAPYAPAHYHWWFESSTARYCGHYEQ